MRNLLRTVPVLVVAGSIAFWAGPLATSSARAAAPEVNACGCYRDAVGSCFCGKRGRCDCPGDCEPRGCEEKRAKEMEKEIQEETRRAKEAERKQLDEAEARRKKEEQAAEESPAASSGNSEGASDEAPREPPASETEAEAQPDKPTAKRTTHGKTKPRAKTRSQ